MGVFDGLKGFMVKWFGIIPATSKVSVTVRENTTKEVNTLKNQLWYRGDPAELEQFYKQIGRLALDGFSLAASTKFWAAVPVANPLIRKIHSGLPRMIADKLAEIVTDDMREPDMEQAYKSRWQEISEDVDFQELLKSSIRKVLSEGDGAFKICVDPDLSDLPLIEFYAGNDVEFIYKRGKLQEVQFVTKYTQGSKEYELIEYYGKGYVKYKLYNSMEAEVNLDTLEETSGLTDVTFEGDYIMAVPLKFYEAAKWPTRGESIYEGKGDMFDAFDECISTWLDAMRAGRVKQYIPDALVPRNQDDGSLLKPDIFNPYIMVGSNLNEDAKEAVATIQGAIDYTGLLTSYTVLLDCCLQGIISPSTLGIDVKKMDNAESQREKEKTTLHTRDTIIGVLSKVLPKLVEAVLKTQDHMQKVQPGDDYDATFEWGQYANPSFEAMVDTVGKAKTYGIMSIEQCVEELYGDSMDDEDKQEEIARIKTELQEAKTTQVDEPAVNDNFMDVGQGDGTNIDTSGEGEDVGQE